MLVVLLVRALLWAGMLFVAVPKYYELNLLGACVFLMRALLMASMLLLFAMLLRSLEDNDLLD